MAAIDAKTYEGNCHCGAIKFSVVLKPLETTPLRSCGCSICTKKGYLFVFPTKSSITVTKCAGTDGLGGGVLTDYAFNSKQLSHRFCATCGTPFGIVRNDLTDDGIFALNARMFRDVDLWSFNVEHNPGPVTPLAYTPLVFPGLAALVAEPLPEGEKIYPGSCHCGAVTFALKSPWLLEKTGPLEMENNQVAECDSCRFLHVPAPRLTYPRPVSRVPMHVSPSDALAVYFSPVGKRFGGATFCRICGCGVGQKIVGPPAERVATLPENVQTMIREKCDIRPVHVRALNFVLGLTEEDRGEWERMKGAVKRERGSKEGKPYVVPE
ncbi:Mss4-like protein [Mycena sanguinolenta]|nr:Mss4-like protein [Mycena sanguinolenta]